MLTNRTKNISRFLKLSGLCVLGVLFLAGCSSGKEDIDEWIQTTKTNARPKLEPLPEPVPYVPYVHKVSGAPTPFDTVRLRSELPVAQGGPDPTRQKQFLESMSLSEIKMVGVLQDKGSATALVSASADGKVYPVVVGNYLGQDYGQVTSISTVGMKLNEQVQDAAGKWIVRETEVPLTEDTK